MGRLRRPRFTLASLLATVALAAAFLSLYPGYAEEQFLLKPLSLPCHDTIVFFNTRIGDPMMIDTTAGYVLTEWRGPRFMETPMRLFGCPWFDRAATIVIYNDGKIALEALQHLRDLDNLRWLAILVPQKPCVDYRDLEDHLCPSTKFDCVGYNFRRLGTME